MIVKSGALAGRALVLDLKDHERALVWIDGRFSHILPPGLHAYWLGQKEVRVEIVDARQVRFDHKDLAVIVRSQGAKLALDIVSVERDRVGVLFIDGRYIDTLAPGQYAFWKGPADARVVEVDQRETTADVSGQEIMTADKVTLRVNANVTYRIVDARKAVSQADDVRQALYRETQLALRAVIGARELDAFLVGKDTVGQEIEQAVRQRAGELGLEIASVGIRDVILPGEMKDLMNKVTEAKKAAEANLISRREETAAIRSQANTAKLLVENPTLMRLRELEVLEKIAAAGHLRVVLGGEKGLADRVTNLL
jgi:regulator of protease activity HflC (stomatin/prohibitin superfamily)